MAAFVVGLDLNRRFYEEIVPEVQRIARQRLIGNVNQWSDSVDIEGFKREKLRQLYE